ncbi:hypothetical protein D3C87_1563370 [compost metagenome]
MLISLSRSASSSWVGTPRLKALMVSPSLVWMSIAEVPVSLNVMVSLSPRSKLIPLNWASSASLSSWSRSSLNWEERPARTALPATSVLAAAAPVRLPAEAPVISSFWVDWFSIRSLPLSFDARILPLRSVLALISETRVSTVLAAKLSAAVTVLSATTPEVEVAEAPPRPRAVPVAPSVAVAVKFSPSARAKVTPALVLVAVKPALDAAACSAAY